MSRRTDLYRELIKDVNEIKSDVQRAYQHGRNDHKVDAQAEIDKLSKAVDYWIAQWEIKKFELKEAELRINKLEKALAEAKSRKEV